MNEIKGLEYTEDGYIVSNGQYIGLKDDNEWDWYGNIDLARNNLKTYNKYEYNRRNKRLYKFCSE